jgi:hypothetical protein
MPKAKFPVRELMPEGVYQGTLVGIDERQAADGRSFWLWTFRINHDGRSVERTAPSSTNFSPRSKARQWAEALMGAKIDDSGTHEFDLDQLTGRACTIVLDVVERDGERFNNVVQVLRAASE